MKDYIEKKTGRRVKAIQCVKDIGIYMLPEGVTIAPTVDDPHRILCGNLLVGGLNDWLVECCETGKFQFFKPAVFPHHFHCVSVEQSVEPLVKCSVLSVQKDILFSRFVVTFYVVNGDEESKTILCRNFGESVWFNTLNHMEGNVVTSTKIDNPDIFEKAFKEYINNQLEEAVEPKRVERDDLAPALAFEEELGHLINKHIPSGATMLEISSLLDLYSMRLKLDLINEIQTS